MTNEIAEENKLNKQRTLDYRLFENGTLKRVINYTIELPKAKLLQKDVYDILKKLRGEISKAKDVRYPLLRTVRHSHNAPDVSEYYLKFSKYSEVGSVSMTTGLQNILKIDFDRSRSLDLDSQETFDQQVGEIYEIAEEIIIKRTYRER